MRVLLFLPAIAAALTALPAKAQTTHSSSVSMIEPGRVVRGSLRRGDVTRADGSYADVYHYHGRPGQRITIRMESSDMDAYLSLGEGLGERHHIVANDDDGGGGTDARLTHTLDSDEVWIWANTLSEGETGNYTLTLTVSDDNVAVDRLPNSREATDRLPNSREATDRLPNSRSTPNARNARVPGATRAQPIRLDQTISGSLTSTDPTLSDDSHFDDYILTARAGEAMVIDLRSSDFDAYLTLGQMVEGEFDNLDTDDDSGGDHDARIRYTFPEDGQYIIRVNSLEGGERGNYTLRVTAGVARPIAPLPAARPITRGQTITGTLTTDDPLLQDDTHHDDYVYSARAGERVAIELSSSDFDTYLVVGRMNSARRFRQLESNDDGEDGTNSYMEFTFPEAGDYIIRVNALSSERSTGTYALSVRAR